MYGHTHNNDTYSLSPDFLVMWGSVTPLPPHHTAVDYFIPPPALVIPAYELDPLYATSSIGYESPSYNSSLTKEIQRSGCSHSIASQLYNYNHSFLNQPGSSPSELLDSEGSSPASMSRVFSAGDLQGTNVVYDHLHHRSEFPLLSESNSIIETMNKACPYSPDEKKERIERYRNKKTQRNFTKKIKYVCRKTLADSRPRIRGRFARNDDISTIAHQCTSQGGGEVELEEEDDDNWMNNFLDPFPSNLLL